jgi:hypothetical protein
VSHLHRKHRKPIAGLQTHTKTHAASLTLALPVPNRYNHHLVHWGSQGKHPAGNDSRTSHALARISACRTNWRSVDTSFDAACSALSNYRHKHASAVVNNAETSKKARCELAPGARCDCAEPSESFISERYFSYFARG